eukprot:712495-Hanusia_phi.AAC.1
MIIRLNLETFGLGRPRRGRAYRVLYGGPPQSGWGRDFRVLEPAPVPTTPTPAAQRLQLFTFNG